MINTEEFLAELTALTLKYQIEIGGCGCCGSPWLTDLSAHKRGKYTCLSLDERLTFVDDYLQSPALLSNGL